MRRRLLFLILLFQLLTVASYGSNIHSTDSEDEQKEEEDYYYSSLESDQDPTQYSSASEGK